MVKQVMKQIEVVLARLELTISQVMNLYFYQILTNGGISLPIEIKSYNQTTIDAFNEDLSNAKKYNSINDLYDELDIES